MEKPRTGTGTAHGTWLTLGRDGRLSLYAPTRGGVLCWHESAVGGPRWEGPRFVAAPDLTDLTVAQGSDGYVHLLGRRERRTPDGAAAVDIVHAIQYQTNRAVTEWRSLGRPDEDPAPGASGGASVGVPVGVIAADGTVHVFVRGAAGGLMLRRESPSGKWRAWEDLLGAGIEGMPAPAALADGRVEVCAATWTGLLVWQQAEAGGRFAAPRGFDLRPLSGTAVALPGGSGRATYFWTDAANGGATAWQFGCRPSALGGSPAGHPYAALRTRLDGYDCVVLAYRGQDGTAVVGAGAVDAASGGFWWYALAERCEGAPALARDGHGRTVMAFIDPEGVAHIGRQDDSAGLSLTRWQRL
ncbi:hypothetical protein ACFQVC_01200 [Streptomyces monticola]|uniref:PLL-like beta propeller domain-containing protein n=1 Tax=Streptomyces monticola TaxID=2666263 RepID=A0ABW2JAJ0_9ACTN